MCVYIYFKFSDIYACFLLILAVKTFCTCIKIVIGTVDCSSSPSEPVNGMIVNLDNINTRENSVITIMCDPGFSPASEMIATCNNSGFWHPDPALLECQRKYIFNIDQKDYNLPI